MAPNTSESGSDEVVKAKDDEISKLKKDIEKANGRVENAENKFRDWAEELGNIRKERDNLKSSFDETKKVLTEAQDLIKALKEQKDAPPTQAGDKTGKEKDKSKETVEDIERGLNDDQRKVGEIAFNDLNDAEKLQYESDPDFRLSFLKRVIDTAPVIPTSPWKTAPKKKEEEPSGHKEILDRIFTRKKQNSFMPPGSMGGAARPKESSYQRPEPPEDIRVH